MKREKALIQSVAIDLNLQGTSPLWIVTYFSGKIRYYFQEHDTIPERVKYFYQTGMLTHKNKAGTFSVYRYGKQDMKEGL